MVLFMIKIIVCGKGGSGIKYMSIILAKSAIKSGYDVKLLISYGPEAREGDIKTYITIDKKKIANPIIKNADYLISFDDSCLETFVDRYSNIIKTKNNMCALGTLAKIINIDLNILIEIMKEETGKKYEELIPINTSNIIKGYDTEEESWKSKE